MQHSIISAKQRIVLPTGLICFHYCCKFISMHVVGLAYYGTMSTHNEEINVSIDFFKPLNNEL